jgi:hypothetical protein
MKITISPTEDQGAEKFPYYAISAEFPHDDHFTLEQAVSMFYQCLLAYGFGSAEAQKTLNEYTP